MKNRAAYMVGLNKMEIRETPVPEPKAGEVLVKIEYVGICGSDVHYFKDGRCGDFVVDGELMLGHEAGGVVEKLGEGVTDLKVGDKVNVERSMIMNGRLDGHIVQGHVDETAKCINMKDADGSTYFTFEYELNKEMARKGYFTVDKGSVTVNGVSLTVIDPTDNTFTVAIIPYTREHTNFADIVVGTEVNLEFDILGKYIARLNHFA